MSLNIVVAPVVRFKIEGKFTSETGAELPFDFYLTGARLATEDDVRAMEDEVKQLTEQGNKTPLTAVLAKRITGWDGVVQPDGPVPYSADALCAVLGRPGMAVLVYMTYLRETGAKAKNS